MKNKALIVGVGLMGASFAKGLQELGGYEVTGFDRDSNALEKGLSEGYLQEGYSSLDDIDFSEVKFVLSCLYPEDFVSFSKKLAPKLPKEAIVTEIAGVKGKMVFEAKKEFDRYGVHLLPSHPMAGGPSQGPALADSKLLKGRPYIVLPFEDTPQWAVDYLVSLGEKLGFSPISKLAVEEHDRLIAYISDLPHALAAAILMDLPEHLVATAGNSFRDFTRIADFNVELWTRLFLLNADAVVEAGEKFQLSFGTLLNAIKEGDEEEIRRILEKAKKERGKLQEVKKA